MSADVDIDPIRYGALYQDVQYLKKDMESVKKDLKEMSDKMDTLISLLDKGKGALWLGALLVTGITSLGWKLVDFFNLKGG